MRHAISLQHDIIAFYEFRDDDGWHPIDKVEIAKLDLAQLVTTVQDHAVKWRERAESIELWFPEDVLISHEITAPHDEAYFYNTAHETLGVTGAVVVFARASKGDAGQEKTIFAMEQGDLNQGLEFIGQFGFSITGVAPAPPTGGKALSATINPPDFAVSPIVADTAAPKKIRKKRKQTQDQVQRPTAKPLKPIAGEHFDDPVANLAVLIGVEADIKLGSDHALSRDEMAQVAPLTETPLSPVPDFLIGKGSKSDVEVVVDTDQTNAQSFQTPEGAPSVALKWLLVSVLLAGGLLASLDIFGKIGAHPLPEPPRILAELTVDETTLAQIYAQTDPLIEAAQPAPEPEAETLPAEAAKPEAETLPADPVEPAPEPVTPEAIEEPKPIEITATEPETLPEAPPPTSIAPDAESEIAPEIDLAASAAPAATPEAISIGDNDPGEKPEFEPFEFVERPKNFVSPTDAPASEAVEAEFTPAETPNTAPSLAMSRPAQRNNDAILRQASAVEAAANEQALAEAATTTNDALPTQTAASEPAQNLSAEEQERALDRANDDGSGPASPIGTGSAASDATFQIGIDLSEIVLLGIQGKINDPTALVLKPNGEELSVKKGSLIDDWKVIAINSELVIIARGGEQRTLRTPKF